jgi:hypothetical protein
MNYYSHSGNFYSPRPNRAGIVYSVFNVLVFVSLLAFGIVSTYCGC